MGGASSEVTAHDRRTCWSSPRTSTRSRSPAPPAGTSCRPRRAGATSAASTPTSPTGAAAAGRPAARRARRRDGADAGVTDVDEREPRGRRCSMPVDLPRPAGRRGLHPRAGRAGAARPSAARSIGCGVEGRRRDAARDELQVLPPSLASGPAAGRRPGRGGRPGARLRPDPVRAAAGARPGRGLTRVQRLRRVGRARAGRARAASRCSPTRSSAERCTTARAAGGRPAAAARCGWPTRCQRAGAAAAHLAAGDPAGGRCAATSPAVSGTSPLFEIGPGLPARAAAPGRRRGPGGGRRPDDAVLAELDAGVPAPAAPGRAVLLAGQREPAGWWGPGGRRTGPTRWTPCRAWRDGAGPADAAWSARTEHAPWHPGRCARLDPGRRHAGRARRRAAPARWSRRSTCPSAPARPRSTSTSWSPRRPR